MRVLIALLVIAYLVGVGVALAPTIKANWSTGPASQFVESVATELPRALSWPATVYHRQQEGSETFSFRAEGMATEEPLSVQILDRKRRSTSPTIPSF